jgi:modification methylase
MAEFPVDRLDTIEQGDTIEKMSALPDACVDLVVTSPPYAVGKDYEKDEDGNRIGLEALLRLLRGCFGEWQRIVKPGGYIFVNFGDNTYGKQELGTEVHSTIPMTVWYWNIAACHAQIELQAVRVWRKTFAKLGIPFICNTEPRPVLDYEHLWVWRKRDGIGKQVVRNHKLSRRAVWDTTKEGLDEQGEPMEKALPKGHGAAFPLAIPKWAIQLYSDPGDVVIDNFMGTGTTAEAAVELGRHYYGIDKSREWVEYACNRVRRGVQLPMEMK